MNGVIVFALVTISILLVAVLFLLREDRYAGTSIAESVEGVTQGGPVRTLLINAGRGTTGTRTLFKATCKMGLKTVHFRNHCRASKEDVELHARLLQSFMVAVDCLRASNSSCPDVETWAKSIQRHLQAVLRSEIQALHDTPYPFLMPHLLMMLKSNGRTPFILVSTRDPESWAKSRIKKHSGAASVLLCRKRVQEALDNQDDARDPFDVLGCASDALSNLPSNAPLPLDSVFQLWSKSSEWMDRLTKMMTLYQKMYTQSANLTFDMWEYAARTGEYANVSTIISELQHSGLKAK